MLVADSAYPLKNYPTEWDGQPIEGYGFYIGGDTPHVWTPEEVAELKNHYRYLLPIYTRDDPQNASATTDAAAALKQLKLLGAPVGILLQWDMESSVDIHYVEDIDESLATADYLVDIYGSASTVVQNGITSGGDNVADWTGKETTPSSTAEQFADMGTYDLNDFPNGAFLLWDTQATVVATEEEEDMSQTSLQGRAGLGWSKGAKHVLQVTWDPGVVETPSFRPVVVLETGPLVIEWTSTFKGKMVAEFPTADMPLISGAYVYGPVDLPFELYAA